MEDDPLVRGTITAMLKQRGCVATAAGNGEEALALLRRRPAPDVILSDLSMPVMDGARLRLALLDDPALSAVPFLLMSGTADIAEKARALDADGALQKPLRFAELVDAVMRAASREPERTPAARR